MSSTAPTTFGELFLILSEMGFSEEQIQAAVAAGNFSVPDAADWLLQGQYPRHSLLKKSNQSAESAISAFNPPKEAASTSFMLTSPSEALPSPPSDNSSPEPLTVESRLKLDTSDFEAQERQRLAQEAKAERRQKQQERELVLKRIAEDRKSQQQKSQTGTVTEMSPPSGQGQRLGGTIKTNVDNQCILMIRLPSGESMRERFPADAPLCSVMEHISRCHPALTSFSLLQGFPRKRFGNTELSCSLRDLGLTPNAALCIQTTPPETPQDAPGPAAPGPAAPGPAAPGPAAPAPSVGQNEESPPPPAPPPVFIPLPEDAAGQNMHLPPPLPNRLWEEAVNYAGIPEAGPSLSRPSHSWGRGQRLVAAEEAAAGIEVDPEEEEEYEPLNMIGTVQYCAPDSGFT
ncbi:actin cytoskeleton-regulatory complex protein PAN1-like isoform X2 [Cynoglossus semilaevis]|uniref:actin cytoskeleton-regulatory complex protein PAN1-like isoform X2 n=1 Tax=Cynoglossus semilaevis TaxID=244447 RepID=UPI000497E4F6|nr:actin cytoskeleton-regulatory complex protein PAN1-like isoform X2 [Cynoglossus semilaevis]